MLERKIHRNSIRTYSKYTGATIYCQAFALPLLKRDKAAFYFIWVCNGYAYIYKPDRTVVRKNKIKNKNKSREIRMHVIRDSLDAGFVFYFACYLRPFVSYS